MVNTIFNKTINLNIIKVQTINTFSVGGKKVILKNGSLRFMLDHTVLLIRCIISITLPIMINLIVTSFYHCVKYIDNFILSNN